MERLQGFPKITLNKSNKTLYIVSLNHAINDGSTTLIATLFPVFLSALSFLPIQIGILVAVGYTMNVVFQPIAGHYSDRVEPKNLLALGIFLMAISMIFFTISEDFTFILTSVIVLRIGSSLFHPVGVSAISKSYTGTKLDSAMGFQSAFGNLGILAVFLVSASLYASQGLGHLFLIFAALDLAMVVFTLVSMRRTRLLVRSDSDPGERSQNDSPTKHYVFKLPIFFIVTMLISGGSYAVLVNYGNSLLLYYNTNLGLLGANLILAGWIASGFVGAMVSGRLSKVAGRIKLLSFAYVSSSLTTFLIGVFPGNLGIAIPAFILNGFALAITYPTVYAELSSFLGIENKKKGPYFGILFSGQIIGSVIMGFFSGYAWQAFGPRIPFEVLGVLLFASFVTTLLWVSSSTKTIAKVLGS